MEMGKGTFKEKFDELSQKMLDLINSASKEDLAKEGIQVIDPTPKIPLLPKDEKEFLKGLIHRTTGRPDTYICQKADMISKEEVEDAFGGKMHVVMPSVIRPSGLRVTFNPYITYFTPDGKLAMLPYEGHFFSDMSTPVGKINRK
jgi:hypothetical protein